MEELEETVESSVCDPLKEKRVDVIEEELHSDCSDLKNVKSSVGLDIGCITNEFPSQVEIEKIYYQWPHPTTQTTPKGPRQSNFSRK